MYILLLVAGWEPLAASVPAHFSSWGAKSERLLLQFSFRFSEELGGTLIYCFLFSLTFHPGGHSTFLVRAEYP